MIRVLQVIECGGPGGTGEQVAAICAGLDPASFEVSLAYAVRAGAPEDYAAKCRARRAFHVPEMTRELSPARDWAAYRALRRIIREERPDVVHAHSSKAGALARAAARAEGVRRVYYSPHGYGFLMQDRSAASRALYRLAETALARLGETVAVSPSEGELARRLGGRAVHVVCDAYLGEFQDPLPHEGAAVGACGRITYARNPQAWARLAKSLAGVRRVWIGGGEDESALRAAVAGEPGVEITGWLAADEARRRLRSLDVFVHYSRWDAMPNAVLEAMAAGLPVVASDVPGNRDAVVDGETGFLVKDEAALLERCVRLLADPGLRRRLGEAGRERVRRDFSRERMLAELSRLYSR